MMRLAIAGLLVVILLGAGFYTFNSARFRAVKSYSLDVDGDGVKDLSFSKSGAGVIEKVEFSSGSVEAKVDRSGKLVIKVGSEDKEVKSERDAEEIVRKLGGKERNVRVRGRKVLIGKKNVTLISVDFEKNETLLNLDGDSRFDVKIKEVGNESVEYEDKDEDGSADVARMFGGKIAIDFNSRTVFIDLNLNGVKDASINIDSMNYSLNYPELVMYFGPGLVNLIKSGNFTSEQAFNEVMKVLKEKDPELYYFVETHRSDIMELLEKIEEGRGIKESASLSFIRFEKPEDTIKAYYSSVCGEKPVGWLMDDSVDANFADKLHRAIYEAFDYSNCKVSNINCEEKKIGGSNETFWLCSYRFEAEVRDTKGRVMKINRTFETLLSKDNLIIWTTGGEEGE